MATNKRFVAKNGVDNNSKTITNVADPASAQDAATKAYVDSKSSGLTLQSTNANAVLYLNASSQATTSTKATYTETSGLPRLSVGTPGFFTSVFGHEINISHTDFVGHAIRNSSAGTGANSGIVFANDANTTNTYSAYIGLSSSTSSNPSAFLLGSYAKMILESSGEMSTRVNANTAFTINTSGQTTFSKLVTTTLGLNANSQKITNLATPTAGTDGANKDYVDNSISNLIQPKTAKAVVFLDSNTNPTSSSSFTVESNHIKLDSRYVHSTYQQDIQFVNQANVEAPFYNVRSVASSAGNATKYNAVAKTKIINPAGDEDVASFGIFQRSDDFADACIHLIRKNYYPNPGGTWWRFTNNGVITTSYDTDWINTTLASNMQHGAIPLRVKRKGNIVQVNGALFRSADNGGTPGWTTTLAYTGILTGQSQVVTVMFYTGGGTPQLQWYVGSVTIETTGAITMGLPVINNGGDFGIIINQTFSLDYY